MTRHWPNGWRHVEKALDRPWSDVTAWPLFLVYPTVHRGQLGVGVWASGMRRGHGMWLRTKVTGPWHALPAMVRQLWPVWWNGVRS